MWHWLHETPPQVIATVLILLLILFGLSEVRQCRKPKENAQKNQNPANYPPFSPNSQYATEEEHRSAERAYWIANIRLKDHPDWIGRFTAIFSALAFGAAFFGYFEVRRQADIAQDTLKEVKSGSAQTDKAVAAAERTAEASMAQVEVSCNTEMEQLRPYIWIRLTDLPMFGPDGQIRIYRRMTNTGRTVAMKVQRVVNMGLLPILPDDGAGLIYPTDQQIVKMPRETFMAPGAEQTGYSNWSFSISPNDWNGVVNGTGLIFVEWGTVRYEDVFGRVHHLWFCSTWHGQSIGTQACPRGNHID